MNSKQLLSTYGLKWNPFDKPPVEGLVATPQIEQFCWRVENAVAEGGFAMISGGVGHGKTDALRLVRHRLDQMSEVQIVEMERPQSGLADLYRELGDKFALDYRVTNRYSCFKALRERWHAHIESTLCRPVVIIDEAQQMLPVVLSELRLMSTAALDSRTIVTVILCGDERLPEKFKQDDLVPLGSRIRIRLVQAPKPKDELVRIITEACAKAGNPNLLTKGLTNTIADHAVGNIRTMMGIAQDLLVEGMRKDLSQLDEKLFVEFCAGNTLPPKGPGRKRT